MVVQGDFLGSHKYSQGLTVSHEAPRYMYRVSLRASMVIVSNSNVMVIVTVMVIVRVIVLVRVIAI